MLNPENLPRVRLEPISCFSISGSIRSRTSANYPGRVVSRAPCFHCRVPRGSASCLARLRRLFAPARRCSGVRATASKTGNTLLKTRSQTPTGSETRVYVSFAILFPPVSCSCFRLLLSRCSFSLIRDAISKTRDVLRSVFSEVTSRRRIGGENEPKRTLAT